MRDAVTVAASLLIGAALGGLGQVARAVLGLKKAYDAAQVPGAAPFVFDHKRFLTTLGMGLAVGVVVGVAVTYFTVTVGAAFTKAQVVLIVSSGYTGTDALEGIFSKT